MDGVEHVLVFVDAPDPDNLVAAMAANAFAPKGATVSVVLTGRRTKLGVAQLSGAAVGAKLKEGKKIPDLLKRTHTSPWTREDSNALLQDNAVRFKKYFDVQKAAGAREMVIYDGGTAMFDPVADEMHVKEFMFDRADLLPGGAKDAHAILGGNDDYWTILNGLQEGKSEEEFGKHLRESVMRTGTGALVDIEKLYAKLKASSGKIAVVVGGGDYGAEEDDGRHRGD